MECCALRAPQPASESLRAQHSKVAQIGRFGRYFRHRAAFQTHPRVHRAHGAQGLRQGCRTGETAGSWPETGEVSMISSSPPAHASTRETHLRRCSSRPPLRLRSCPPRQRKQVASEGLRGARVCPQLTSNSRAGDTQDGARSSKNLDGCTRASPRPSLFATTAQKRALPWSTTAQPDQ